MSLPLSETAAITKKKFVVSYMNQQQLFFNGFVHDSISSHFCESTHGRKIPLGVPSCLQIVLSLVVGGIDWIHPARTLSFDYN